DISVRNLDHPGLVAAMCDELGIAAMIDTLLPSMHPAKVSAEQIISVPERKSPGTNLLVAPGFRQYTSGLTQYLLPLKNHVKFPCHDVSGGRLKNTITEQAE
ncbi:DUF4277 domain-containing protein, partial [Salmonella enterica subsp. enterica]|nr:DUF4277 domain-containing protein [Salmonella enterica subsp. enterica]